MTAKKKRRDKTDIGVISIKKDQTGKFVVIVKNVNQNIIVRYHSLLKDILVKLFPKYELTMVPNRVRLQILGTNMYQPILIKDYITTTDTFGIFVTNDTNVRKANQNTFKYYKININIYNTDFDADPKPPLGVFIEKDPNTSDLVLRYHGADETVDAARLKLTFDLMRTMLKLFSIQQHNAIQANYAKAKIQTNIIFKQSADVAKSVQESIIKLPGFSRVCHETSATYKTSSYPEIAKFDELKMDDKVIQELKDTGFSVLNGHNVMLFRNNVGDEYIITCTCTDKTKWYPRVLPLGGIHKNDLFPLVPCCFKGIGAKTSETRINKEKDRHQQYMKFIKGEIPTYEDLMNTNAWTSGTDMDAVSQVTLKILKKGAIGDLKENQHPHIGYILQSAFEDVFRQKYGVRSKDVIRMGVSDKHEHSFIRAVFYAARNKFSTDVDINNVLKYVNDNSHLFSDAGYGGKLKIRIYEAYFKCNIVVFGIDSNGDGIIGLYDDTKTTYEFGTVRYDKTVIVYQNSGTEFVSYPMPYYEPIGLRTVVEQPIFLFDGTMYDILRAIVLRCNIIEVCTYPIPPNFKPVSQDFDSLGRTRAFVLRHTETGKNILIFCTPYPSVFEADIPQNQATPFNLDIKNDINTIEIYERSLIQMLQRDIDIDVKLNGDHTICFKDTHMLYVPGVQPVHMPECSATAEVTDFDRYLIARRVVDSTLNNLQQLQMMEPGTTDDDKLFDKLNLEIVPLSSPVGYKRIMDMSKSRYVSTIVPNIDTPLFKSRDIYKYYLRLFRWIGFGAKDTSGMMLRRDLYSKIKKFDSNVIYRKMLSTIDTIIDTKIHTEVPDTLPHTFYLRNIDRISKYVSLGLEYDESNIEMYIRAVAYISEAYPMYTNYINIQNINIYNYKNKAYIAL